jgi:hypothetical protein
MANEPPTELELRLLDAKWNAAAILAAAYTASRSKPSDEEIVKAFRRMLRELDKLTPQL